MLLVQPMDIIGKHAPGPELEINAGALDTLHLWLPKTEFPKTAQILQTSALQHSVE